ncbi:MAG: EAL domain-containing protein [Atribacterota bacterium]
MESFGGSLLALASFASFSVAYFLAVYLVSHFRRDPELYFAHGMFMCFALWAFGFAMVQVASSYERAFFWVRVAAVGRTIGYSLFLHWVLTVSQSRWLKNRWFPVWLYLPAGVNILVFGFWSGVSEALYRFEKTPFGWVALPAPHFWNDFYSGYVAVYILLGVMLLFGWGKRAKEARIRRQAYAIASAILVVFIVAWTMDRIVAVFFRVHYPPVAPILILFPFIVIYVTMFRRQVFFSLPTRSEGAQKGEILDRLEKIRLYSFLSLVYVLDGVAYVLYTHLVLRYPLETAFPWGALFILLGMAVHYLGTLNVEETVRDLLYVGLVSFIALLLAPRVHFLGEVLYASFFFTAVVVAVLLSNPFLFVLQGALMGGILLFLWRWSLPFLPADGLVNFQTLLFSFLLFFVLSLYVHRVYRRRLRQSQIQLEREQVVGTVSTLLADLNYADFEQGFPRVLQAMGYSGCFHRSSFFLFSPVGKELMEVSRWCYGEGCPKGFPDFSGFALLLEKGKGGEGFTVDFSGTPLEREFLSQVGVETVFLQPVKRGGEILGFLGCGIKNGSSRESSCPDLIRVLSHRMTDAFMRIIQEKHLHHAILYDSLTGLPNRILFGEHLEKAIQLARRTGKVLGILLLDLDDFKTINNSEGHEVGDRLLQHLAHRLMRCVREQDTVARFGGDEFLVLFPQLDYLEEVLPVVERILASFRQPFVLEDQEFFLTASIGIAQYPKDGETPQDLIKNADLAMYVAKGQRGNGYAFCSLEIREQALAQKNLIIGLYRALERKEFLLYYQPQVNARRGNIVGVEALLRWNHPQMGIVLPRTFVPLAEQTGLMVPIGEWVLQVSCAQVVRWQKESAFPLRLSVNLSTTQLRDAELVRKVERILTETDFDPRYLDLEITETMFLHDPEHTSQILHALRRLGVGVTLDDFGVEYSWFTRLKTLPVDRIKIDRSFLKDFPDNPNHQELVRGIIRMARSLNIQVIAEGVETEEQVVFLLKEGCETVQGFYYYQPLPPKELERILVSPWKL